MQAAIYYNTSKTSSNYDWTAISFAQERISLTNLGYTNVSDHSSLSMGKKQIARVLDMLQNEKPVLVGAIAKAVSNSHYFIIDGINDFHGYTDFTNFHINWGWGGCYNGWFSNNCIRNTDAFNGAYDPNPINNGITPSGHTNSAYMEFEVYTYDNAPSTTHIFYTNIKNHYFCNETFH